MTLDGLLTLLTLLAAIYALLPKATRLRLGLGAKFQIPTALAALLIILYVQFNVQAISLCTAVMGQACENLPLLTGDSALLTAPQLSFFIVFGWATLVYAIHFFFSRPRAHSSLPTISKLVDNLIYEQRYAELIDLVEPRLSIVDRAANRLLLLQKLHDKIRLLGDENQEFSRYPNRRYTSERVRSPNVFVRKTCRTVSKLATVIPAYRQTQVVARNIIRALCQSKDLRNYILEVRPYFALSLLQLRETKDFSDAYFRGLISDTNSILYQELKRNSDFSPGIRPWEGNRLLEFLFNDASVAKKLGVWKPIGEYMKEFLQPDGSPNPEFTVTLCRKANSSHDERWRNPDPIRTGIYFFDVMVTAAAMQGIQWHMWLYYLVYVVERLEQVYDTSSPKVDESDQFPIRSARLIDESIRVLCRWVLLVKELPLDSPHRNSIVFVGQGDSITHKNQYDDNANIPVSAANALGMCMRKILLSRNISIQTKSCMYNTVVETLDELEDEHWRQLLVHCIVDSGPVYRRVNREYGEVLKSLSSEVDFLLWKRVSDLDREIKQTYG